MLDPVPPRVKLGRTTHGSPMSSTVFRASRRLPTVCPRGTSSPIRSIAALNWSRDSAFSITAALAPIISTPNFSSTPWSVQIHRQVQAGLAAKRRQQGVGPLGLDHLGHHLPGQRLDVRAVGHLRVGHDRGRIRVDQHDHVPFLAQGLARLRARVIELAGLPDDDRPGTDQQDFLDVVATWHSKNFLGANPREQFRRSPLLGGRTPCKIP